MDFPKKFMFGTNGPFKTKNDAFSQLWIYSKNYVTILHNERVQERPGNYINGSSEKNLVRGYLVILPKN